MSDEVEETGLFSDRSEINSNVPVDNVITLDDFIGSTLTQQSFNMQLLAIFGLLALILCSIGIYSVLAYSVKRRMREIGLRLAFGASLRDVATLVVAQGMKPTLIGIGIGLVTTFAFGRVAASLIYGVSVRDLATFHFGNAAHRAHLVCCQSHPRVKDNTRGPSEGPARRVGFAHSSPRVIDLTSREPYSRGNESLFHAGRLLRMLLCAAPDYGISRL